LRQWDLLIPDLEQAGWQAIAPDLTGHGASPRLNGQDGPTVERLYEDFVDWLEGVPLSGPPVFVAHSMGAYLGLSYALRSGRPVRGLFLANPLYCHDQVSPHASSVISRPILYETLLPRLPGGIVRLALRYLTRDGKHLSAAVLHSMAEDYRQLDPRAMAIPNTCLDLSEQAGRLRLPIMVAWGANDRTLQPDTFRKLVASLSDAAWQELPGGHLPHLAHPGAFNRAVLEFLGGLPEPVG